MRLRRTLLVLILAAATVSVPWNEVLAKSRHNYYFDQDHSHLKGAIKYTIIGNYRAQFQEFEGTLRFDEKNVENSSVELKVKTGSIHSKYPRLDRIVRSARLLNSAKYPYITFKSTSIKRTSEGYRINGVVTLNKITKDLSFLFHFDGPTRKGKERYIDAYGRWVLNRKDFEIIWSQWLDHGGVIVGNNITVDWEVKAYR